MKNRIISLILLVLFIVSASLSACNPYAKGSTKKQNNEQKLFTFERFAEDLSGYGEIISGKKITREELSGTLENGYCKTYLFTGDTYDMIYIFPFSTHINDKHDTAFNGRSISFLIGQGSNEMLGTMNVSSGSDYAYLIKKYVQREYRNAEENERNAVIANSSLLCCYVENPDGTVDAFWIDSKRYIIHRTGNGLPGNDFTDISTEPLTEEEYAQIHAIAASYLYQTTSLDFNMFRYQSIDLVSTASIPICVKMIKNGVETVLSDKEVDELIKIAMETEASNTEVDKTLYSCASETDLDWDKMTHFLVIDKNNDWESAKYLDDFYLTDDGKAIRKKKVLQFTYTGGSEAMNVMGPFIISTLYSYPFELINNK